MRISDWSSDVCSSDLLTGGQHVSDASNASRTQLMALDGTDWDIGLCDLFGVPPQALPEIVDNIGAFGATQAEWFGQPIEIRGLEGDQPGETSGQAERKRVGEGKGGTGSVGVGGRGKMT